MEIVNLVGGVQAPLSDTKNLGSIYERGNPIKSSLNVYIHQLYVMINNG